MIGDHDALTRRSAAVILPVQSSHKGHAAMTQTIATLQGDQTGQELLLEALRVIDPR